MSHTAVVPDPLERMRDERVQINELFDSFARQQQDPAHKPAETARLSAWICTLLRVHDDLETRVLEPALSRSAGTHPGLERAAALRLLVRLAVDRVEASPVHGPVHRLEMAALARHARNWFEIEERELCALAQRTASDLAALDDELGRRQEQLLSAGRNPQH